MRDVFFLFALSFFVCALQVFLSVLLEGQNSREFSRNFEALPAETPQNSGAEVLRSGLLRENGHNICSSLVKLFALLSRAELSHSS